MKKFTLALSIFFVFSTMVGQTYSTGTIQLSNTAGLTYSAKIDVTSSLVTLTLVGPADRYLGLGFGVNSMTTGGDVVMYLEAPTAELSDRTFQGVGVVPSSDASQSWTITSNTVASNVRTLVATRARVSAGDYTFSNAAGPLMLVWSRGNTASYDLVYHGGANRGALTTNLTLGTEDFAVQSFKMYPNPTKDYTTIELPSAISSGEVKVYDNLGRVVSKQTITPQENKIDTSFLSQGSYMVVLRTDYGNSTKTLLVD